MNHEFIKLQFHDLHEIGYSYFSDGNQIVISLRISIHNHSGDLHYNNN